MISTVDLKQTRFLLSAEYQYQGIHSGVLIVYFRAGGIRAYQNVPHTIWNKLLTDDSPSKVYVNEVKEKFNVVVIRATPSKRPKINGQFKMF